MKPFFKYWLPVLAWAGVIFILSSISGDKFPTILPGIQDIIVHLFEYAILALLLSRALKNSRFSSRNKPQQILTVILVCLIYAISDEFHQIFVMNREPSLIDFFSDAFGVVLGSFIYPW